MVVLMLSSQTVLMSEPSPGLLFLYSFPWYMLTVSFDLGMTPHMKKKKSLSAKINVLTFHQMETVSSHMW